MAFSALNSLTKKLDPEPPKPGEPSTAEVSKVAASTAEAKAALAYAVYRVDAQKKVVLAKPADTYKAGEGVTIALTNNVPGVLDVDNIDANGTRVTLEAMALADIKQILLSAKTAGYYNVNDDGRGSEVLELRFFQCAPTQKETESMSAIADKVVADLAARTALKPETVKALGACPSKSQRDAVKSAKTESMGMVENTSVAAAAKTLAAPAQSAGLTPVVVVIRIERAK